MMITVWWCPNNVVQGSCQIALTDQSQLQNKKTSKPDPFPYQIMTLVSKLQ